MSITVRLTPTSHHVEFEIGSAEEGIGFIEEKGAGFMRLLDVLGRLSKAESETALASGVVEQPGEPAKERKPRGPNKPKVEAVAPAPLPVPGAAPSAPPAPPALVAATVLGAPIATVGGDPLAIPAELKRDATNASPAIPAAPPPAPLTPPALPPTGVLAEKIIANLDARKVGTPDGGQSLADWLASCGITIKGATYDEAVAVLRLQTDAKLEPLVGALGL